MRPHDLTSERDGWMGLLSPRLRKARDGQHRERNGSGTPTTPHQRILRRKREIGARNAAACCFFKKTEGPMTTIFHTHRRFPIALAFEPRLTSLAHFDQLHLGGTLSSASVIAGLSAIPFRQLTLQQEHEEKLCEHRSFVLAATCVSLSFFMRGFVFVSTYFQARPGRPSMSRSSSTPVPLRRFRTGNTADTSGCLPKLLLVSRRADQRLE
jgi:hypothetical protein